MERRDQRRKCGQNLKNYSMVWLFYMVPIRQNLSIFPKVLIWLSYITGCGSVFGDMMHYEFYHGSTTDVWKVEKNAYEDEAS